MTAELQTWLQTQCDRLAEAAPQLTRESLAELRPLLVLSDYAGERLRRTPQTLDQLKTAPALLELPDGFEHEWLARIRRFRHQHSLALIAAEAAGAPIETILRGSSGLADHCATQALAAAMRSLVGRHGSPCNAAGEPQSLVVYGLGKLGGYELNFSSDIDLVFAYPEGGQTDGARGLDNETFFLRLGQRLIQLLGEVSAEGFGFRVDMRLRPFGSAGRLALSFSAMEQYFQREGRDWERYAWIKARPIAGDIAAGESLLETLRPFMYRRYLDYHAFDGLREMKAMIEAEVERRELADHVKLGPGGIREIEFIVQLQQLVRGGRAPSLRARGLREALAATVALGHIEGAVAQRLQQAYDFLRRLENRLQMLRDDQVHELPTDPFTRTRLAVGLGFADWDALFAALQQHRQLVREEFMRVFEARAQRSAQSAEPFRIYWQRIERDATVTELAAAGWSDAAAAHERLQALAASPGVRGLSAASRGRLDRVLPELLVECVKRDHGHSILPRLLSLLQAVLRRSSYLALLDEQPAALRRLVDVMARSALLAERIGAHPLLLDDLLDNRAQGPLPTPAQMRVELAAAARGEDREQVLAALNEVRQSFAFRIALAALARRESAVFIAGLLADLAGAVLEAVLPLALTDVQRQHGRLPGPGEYAGLGVIGYGSLGGRELGFSSDLDLVFLFDESATGESDGPRPLDALRYRQRVVQKLITLLSTLTGAGRLYEVDVRLRPDGAKGLLLSSLSHFENYQFERAWTWEHQALVRARPLTGDSPVLSRFAGIRERVLGREREPGSLRREVAAMRARMRAELDRSSALGFDLKQGDGGLVDLEFLLQLAVLETAATQPELMKHTASVELLPALTACGWLAPDEGVALQRAHEALAVQSLACTLDARPRLASLDASIDSAREAVRSVWRRVGLE